MDSVWRTIYKSDSSYAERVQTRLLRLERKMEELDQDQLGNLSHSSQLGIKIGKKESTYLNGAFSFVLTLSSSQSGDHRIGVEIQKRE